MKCNLGVKWGKVDGELCVFVGGAFVCFVGRFAIVSKVNEGQGKWQRLQRNGYFEHSFSCNIVQCEKAVASARYRLQHSTLSLVSRQCTVNMLRYWYRTTRKSKVWYVVHTHVVET